MNNNEHTHLYNKIRIKNAKSDCFVGHVKVHLQVRFRNVLSRSVSLRFTTKNALDYDFASGAFSEPKTSLQIAKKQRQIALRNRTCQ
jgi:hypothetical protein